MVDHGPAPGGSEIPGDHIPGDQSSGGSRDDQVGSGAGEEDRADEGLGHLQAAALEMIEAARAFLDVMEDFVADRDKLSGTLETVGLLAEGLARRASERPAPEGPDEGPVQHISVS